MSDKTLVEPLTDEVLEQIKKLLADATPGDISTAEAHESGDYECPMCGGEGWIDGETFVNIDGRALNVQFSGIGQEFGTHASLWKLLLKHAPAMIARIAELEALPTYDKGLEDARQAVCAVNDWQDENRINALEDAELAIQAIPRRALKGKKP